MTRIPPLVKRRQGGVALIEALLAAVLLAIGLLGTIGLQARAYSALSEAGMRAEATIATERLLGVMMTDVSNLGAYTTGATANARLAPWLAQTQKGIPGATVVVTVTPPAAGATGAPNDVTITLSWKRDANGPTNSHAVRAFI